MSIKVIFAISLICVAGYMTFGLLRQNGYLLKNRAASKHDVLWWIILCIVAALVLYIKGIVDNAPVTADIPYIFRNFNIMSLIGQAFIFVMGGGFLGGIFYLVISFILKTQQNRR